MRNPRTILCSACNSDQMITDPDRGEIICSNCGRVMTDKVQEIQPEWSAFVYADKDNTRIRTGARSSLARHDMGLYTIIGETNKDASGHNLSAPVHSTMSRLRVWDNRIQLDPLLFAFS